MGFRESVAQLIVSVGHHRRIPDMATPAPGLGLANTTQIYPEGRGTKYGVRQGGEAAEILVTSAVEACRRAADRLLAEHGRAREACPGPGRSKRR